MRKILYIFISLLVSCDVVDSGQYLAPYEPGVKTNQHVLLEEYTGMKCVNCPAAAVQAQLLRNIYGDRLIVVSIHAGAFAVPAGIFTQDLRTEAGNDYFSWFRFAGTPVGAVNRAPYGGSLSVNPNSWASAVKQQFGLTSALELTITTEFDATARSLTTLSTITGDESVELNSLKLNVWLVEDNISTPQIIPSGIDHNYMQRHVLRHTLSDTWGEIIIPEPKAELKPELSINLQSNVQDHLRPSSQVNLQADSQINLPTAVQVATQPSQQISQQIPQQSPQQTATVKHITALPSNYNVSQCSIVAFISDASTSRIIQVTQKAVSQRPIQLSPASN